jgi:pentatricopeptide repeat protein
MSLLEEGTSRGLRWDSRTFSALLVACGEQKELATGKRVHAIAQKHGASQGVEYLSSLMSMYAGCGEIAQAEAVFADLVQRGMANEYTYGIMINAYARSSNVRSAMSLLEEGTSRGLRWDSRTFCALLVACGDNSLSAFGERVHAIAQKHGAADGTPYLNSLLYFYARRQLFDEANVLFERMKQRGLANGVSYGALMSGMIIVSCQHLMRSWQASQRAGAHRRCSKYSTT